MPDSLALVYPHIPSPCSVVMVVEDDCSILVENIKQCLLYSGITVQVRRVEDVRTVSHCQLVVAAMLDMETACKINTMARDSLTPFLYCKMVSGNCTVFYDQGEDNLRLVQGHLRVDGLAVHVGSVHHGEEGEEMNIISCDRNHYLKEGDSMMVGSGKMVVMEVMSDKEVKVSHGAGRECKQGDLVQLFLSPGESSPLHRYL